MATIRLRFNYNKYSWQPPKVSKIDFERLKTLNQKDIKRTYKLNTNFFKDSILQLIIIVTAIVGIIYSIYADKIGDFLEIIIVFISFLGFLSIVSLLKSFSSYMDISTGHDTYIEHLIKSLNTASNYSEFCKLMEEKFPSQTKLN